VGIRAAALPLSRSLVSDLGLSAILIAAAGLFLPQLDPSSNRPRFLIFGLCVFLSWRYLAWRFAATIPPLAPTLDSLYPWTFAVLETVMTVGATISLLTLSRTVDRSGEATRHRAWLDGLLPPPKVDVLIATYNEEESILRRTIVGALGIDYPNFRVWVLDDGRRTWLKDLCRAKGAGYLTRPDNRHAKAGNINHALDVLCNIANPPEFVAVLDADFVPQSNFLLRTMPLFHEESVGLVQTPQHFFNNDPIQANLLIANVWPNEQCFFFDHVLPSKDAWGAAFCCGTSSVIRVHALRQIGGFATTSVTEDFLVTLKLSCAGWRTIYLNEPLSTGLAPEGIKEYLTQRGRWCLGFMQIVCSPLGPFCCNRLSLALRIGLVDTFIYWVFSFFFRFICLIIPIIYWFTGLKVASAPLDQIGQYFLPYYLSVIIAFGWATSGLMKPILTDVSNLLPMFECMKASVIGLARPYGHPFKVTAKGGRRDRLTVAWPMIFRFGSIAALTLLGMLYGSFADFAPSHDRFDAKLINIIWSIYNIIVIVLAISVCIELPRYRREERFATAETVRVRAGDQVLAARLSDLSVSGARIEAPRPQREAEVTLTVHQVGDIRARIVRGSEQMFAVEFIATDSARDELIRKLFSGQFRAPRATVRSGPLALALLARMLR
jgi:cellulose synthase (UDP-forming)